MSLQLDAGKPLVHYAISRATFLDADGQPAT